jgi:hypothetical protein
MSFETSRNVKKTRKRCKCGWCWEPINPGEPSVYVSGAWEGEFFTARYHPECDKAIPRWYEQEKAWGEPMPEERMNRGGIELYGEEEAQ